MDRSFDQICTYEKTKLTGDGIHVTGYNGFYPMRHDQRAVARVAEEQDVAFSSFIDHSG